MYSYEINTMRGKDSVATDKARIVTYCDPDIKVKLEQLAALKIRSLSNLVELLLMQAVADAEESGELSQGTEATDKN